MGELSTILLELREVRVRVDDIAERLAAHCAAEEALARSHAGRIPALVALAAYVSAAVAVATLFMR